MATQEPSADARALAKALGSVFVSPNESDSNGESANVVDGLYAIARSIAYLAEVIQKMVDKEQGEDGV